MFALGLAVFFLILAIVLLVASRPSVRPVAPSDLHCGDVVDVHGDRYMVTDTCGDTFKGYPLSGHGKPVYFEAHDISHARRGSSEEWETLVGSFV